MKQNRITTLLGIQYPIIQGGMVWCSGWRLAAAVSEAGGLGLIGAGSMAPELLEEHIQKCKAATSKPFGVNLPLLYSGVDRQIEVVLRQKVQIVFTSAGNPKTWTPLLKQHGITVVHVVSSVLFARKAEEAGVDAVVAEGFEAGGHNGRDETTTFCLIPAVSAAVGIPVIAAGGIAGGRAMLAAMALGAEAVQAGTVFAACSESSAHEAFKKKLTEAKEGDTVLTLKQLTPVRLLKNNFYQAVKEAEEKGATAEELKTLLGKGRSRKGIFEGNLEDGELEIGQVVSTVQAIEPAAVVVKRMWEEYQVARERMLKQ